MSGERKILVESLVTDAVCPHGGCQDCAEARTRWARRQVIADAVERMFDEAAVPSARMPGPVERRADA